MTEAVRAGEYGGAEAARILGLNYWTLYSWDRSRLLKPSRRTGRGKGARRHYSFADLLCAKTIMRLREAGAPTRRIRKALKALRADAERALRELGSKLVVIGDDVKLVSDEQTLLSLVRHPGQTEARTIVMVEVGAEARDLAQKIVTLHEERAKRTAQRKAKTSAAESRRAKRQGAAA